MQNLHKVFLAGIHPGILTALSMMLFICNFSLRRMYNAYGKLVMNVQYICGLCFDILIFFSPSSILLFNFFTFTGLWRYGKC